MTALRHMPPLTINQRWSPLQAMPYHGRIHPEECLATWGMFGASQRLETLTSRFIARATRPSDNTKWV